jgi:hypothetical protein
LSFLFLPVDVDDVCSIRYFFHTSKLKRKLCN